MRLSLQLVYWWKCKNILKLYWNIFEIFWEIFEKHKVSELVDANKFWFISFHQSSNPIYWQKQKK